MQVYLVYAPEDSLFAKQLASDLQQNQINCVLAQDDTDAQFSALQNAQAILVALSEAATTDSRVLSTLEAVKQTGQRIIALRIGAVDHLPSTLKGVLPLNFSDLDLYEDALMTLLEDLAPPQHSVTALPSEIQNALDSDDPDLQHEGLELLGSMRYELDPDVLEVVEQRLRDLAFKATDPGVKHLARHTLQLLDESDQDDDDGQIEDLIPTAPLTRQRPKSAPPPPSPVTSPRPATAARHRRPLWNSIQWGALPVIGVILALLEAMIARQVVLALPIALVWLLLPWLNVKIRDGGRMEWKMPGPLIGNAFIAIVICLITLSISALFVDIELLDFVIFLGLGTIFGGLIGWLSTLYV